MEQENGLEIKEIKWTDEELARYNQLTVVLRWNIAMVCQVFGVPPEYFQNNLNVQGREQS